MSDADERTENYQNCWDDGYLNLNQRQQFRPSLINSNYIASNEHEPQNNFYELFGGGGRMAISNIIPQYQQQQQQQPQPQNASHLIIGGSSSYLPQSSASLHRPLTTTSIPNTNGSFQDHSPVPEVKKRIIAEVKPMRMRLSYSDVLSKSRSSNGQQEGDETPSSPRNFVQNNLKNVEKKTPQVERKQPPIMPLSSAKSAEENTTAIKKKKEVHSSSSTTQKKKLTTSKSNPTITMHAKQTGSKAEPVLKKKYKKIEVDTAQSRNSSKQGSVSSTSDDKEGYYNVTKTEKPPSHIKEGIVNSRKSRPNGISSNKKSNKRSKKDNHQNSQSNSNTTELLNALLNKVFENILKLFVWLFYLIYDIVVIGFSMAYERSLFYYSIYIIRFKSFVKDIHTNSDKPSIWMKLKWKKFDARFQKTSKWAFWRHFYKKKTVEANPEFYKNGRLPSTNEEAMNSLLNCKGKDAYSILGVTADCSQELIRKHYKKIAVLVHPDKNKQAGAEEAFKVLRRAFELVGEAESRKTYDRSLLEALNAEKAWSELSQLLSQLQTKISEAANTIRCSSCGSRHPRKLTDRAQYAARECNSCKIRHPAKEGDIWAETSFFGLRWKYLALMESKVYDITEWANCQKGALSHLQPNSHVVQYRIVRGGQQQQNQQSTTKFNRDRQRFRNDRPMGEPSLHDFLDNLYSGQNPNGNFQKPPSTTSKRRNRRN